MCFFTLLYYKSIKFQQTSLTCNSLTLSLSSGAKMFEGERKTFSPGACVCDGLAYRLTGKFVEKSLKCAYMLEKTQKTFNRDYKIKQSMRVDRGHL